MSELKPTFENLMDPYVLQLIQALAERDDRIERLTAKIDELDVWDEGQELKIERLTAEKQANAQKQWEAACEVYRASNERLQARVERLEGIIRRALAVPPNWGGEVYEIEEILKEVSDE